MLVNPLQVRAVQANRHNNVYVDTSSARSILPGLIEWAVHEIGAHRILYKNAKQLLGL